MSRLLEPEELPAESWPRLVRDLQKQHVHHRVTIEEREPALEEDDVSPWCVVQRAPLLGLSFTTLPRPAVEVAWRGGDGDTLFHRVEAPARLRHLRDALGREVEVRIDRADGGSTRLTFSP
jgi:hypothetical protein